MNENKKIIDIFAPDFQPDYSGMWLKQWRLRYFFLLGNKLYFSKGPNTKPHGVINLSDCISIRHLQSSNKPNCIELQLKDERYLIYSENEEEKDKWICVLNKAVIINHPSYLRE